MAASGAASLCHARASQGERLVSFRIDYVNRGNCATARGAALCIMQWIFLWRAVRQVNHCLAATCTSICRFLVMQIMHRYAGRGFEWCSTAARDRHFGRGGANRVALANMVPMYTVRRSWVIRFTWSSAGHSSNADSLWLVRWDSLYCRFQMRDASCIKTSSSTISAAILSLQDLASMPLVIAARRGRAQSNATKSHAFGGG
jgi:hypothetical protein